MTNVRAIAVDAAARNRPAADRHGAARGRRRVGGRRRPQALKDRRCVHIEAEFWVASPS